MQTDLNSLNLWEEKYENKAVLVALNNCLHFFLCDNNCDNYHLLWGFFFFLRQAMCLSLILKDWNCLSFTTEEVLSLYRIAGRLALHEIEHIQNTQQGNSLAIQWLGLQAFTAGSPPLGVQGSIPGWGTKIQQATGYSPK